MKKIKQIHDYTGLCAPSLFQEAIARYLQQSEYGAEYLQSVRTRLYENFKVLHTYLTEKGFRIPDIKGGYFIWAEIPEGLPDGYELALDLYREQQVAVVPGEHFSEHGERFLRFNIARNPDEISKAIEQMNHFFKKYDL